MGQCYSKQAIEQQITFRNNNRPQKCYLIQNPPSLIIQLSNGSIETIPIKTSLSNIQITMRVQPGIYFSTNNQIYLFVQVENINNQKLLHTAHAYYQAYISKPIPPPTTKSSSSNNYNYSQNQPQYSNPQIQPQSAYLIRKQNKYIFIMQSKPLGPNTYKFVDLIDLGYKMKQKQISWQDLQYSQIITQVCRKYGQIQQKQGGISNIIIGTDGSVHLLSFYYYGVPQNKDRQHLQKILLQALYGKKQLSIQSCITYQQNSQFKHPSSLYSLKNISNKIKQQKLNKYSNITNPSLKFIKDYITAYYYKLQLYSKQFIDTLMLLGQYNKAEQLLQSHMLKIDAYNKITDQNFENYIKILRIKEQLKPKSLQYNQAKTRVYNSAKYLANKYKKQNNYTKSQKYYYYALNYSIGKSQVQLYVELAQINRALNKNIDAESILMEGLVQYPDSRLLYMWLIVYICDCVKVTQAQQLLFKATPYFRTLQMEICSAKILLGKAIINPPKRGQYIEKAQQCLTKTVIQNYLKQPQSASIPTTLALYYQTIADCYFQSYNFPKAQQYYHTSKVLLKNDQVTSYRLANIIAAQANCLMLVKKYQQSVAAYNQAEELLKNSQCKNLRDSIRGNKGIVKMRMGAWEDGKKQIQAVLTETDKSILKTDYNYIFLKNVLERSKEQEI